METNNTAPALTPESAINVLDVATRPENTGKLSRADYSNIEIALRFLREHLSEEGV